MRRSISRLHLALALVVLLGCAPPEGRIGAECIAPAAPGGGWDLTCRALARIGSSLAADRPPFRVTNMTGAGGGVAYAHTVTQRARDESLLVAASPSTTLRLAQGQYGPLDVDDVRWVGAVGAEYGVVAVAADAPWQSLDDLLGTLRSDPGSVIVSGGSAVAGQDHMKILLLARSVGARARRIRYVPFDGGGEAMTSVLGGFVHVFSGEASEVEALHESRDLRVLAVLAEERLDGVFAAVPTARELGHDVVWVTWRGFYAPGGISDSAYVRWVDLLDRVGTSPEWDRVRTQSRLEAFHLTGPAFGRFVREQVDEFRALSREIGLLE